MLHMLPKTDDGQQRIKKYLLENATPEVKPIPKEDQKDEKIEKKDDKPDWKDKKNDAYNEYDYSDNKDTEVKDW